MLTVSLFKLSLCSTIFPLSSLIILINIVLSAVSCMLLSYISLNSFWGDFSCFFLGTYFFVSPFWLPLCICFCLLFRSAMSPSHGRVSSCSQYPVGPGCSVYLITWAGYSKCPLWGNVSPPVVVESQSLLACSWVGLTISLTGGKNWSWPYCKHWSHEVESAPSGFLCLLRSPFGNAACRANWFLLWCVLQPATGCWFLDLLGRTLV